jgi:hypothetical protein
MVARRRMLCRQVVGAPLAQNSHGSGNGDTRLVSSKMVGIGLDFESTNLRRLLLVNGHDRATVGTDATIGSWVLTSRGCKHGARWVSVLV